MGAASWVQTLPLISAAPSGNTWFWSLEISHFKGFFYSFGSTAFEPEMRLAFIFIETLTHRIITKKHLQIKTRQDIQEEIRKQSSPSEWVFLFIFFVCLFFKLYKAHLKPLLWNGLHVIYRSLHFGVERSGARTPCGDWGLYPQRQLCSIHSTYY